MAKPGAKLIPIPLLCFSVYVGVQSALVSAAPGEDDALKRCRVLHQQIDRYTRLRRAGGVSAQMERWRQARQIREQEYRRKRCARYGRRVRENH